MISRRPGRWKTKPINANSVLVGRIILAGAGEETVACSRMVGDDNTGFIYDVAQLIERHALGVPVEKGNVRLAIVAILGRAMLLLDRRLFPVAEIYRAGAQSDFGWIEFV